MSSTSLFLLPLFYSEFIIWYKRSNLRVMTFRLIPAVCESTGEIQVDETLERRVAEAIPEYEDDFEVLLATVELSQPLYPLLSEQNCRPTYTDIPFKQRKHLYPITERGRRLLETRIDTSIIPLREALFEKVIAKVESERDRKLGIDGGKALLQIADVSEKEFDASLKNLESDLLSGRISRSSDKRFPIEGAGLSNNLLCYDRHKPFPNSDIGYFYDFALIVRELWKNSPEVQAKVDKLAKAIKPLKNNKAMLWELVGASSEELQDLDALTEREYPAISCLIFLKLQDEILQKEILEKTSFLILVEKFKELNYQKDLAIGLWMTGICFGFDTFCSTYYNL